MLLIGSDWHDNRPWGSIKEAGLAGRRRDTGRGEQKPREATREGQGDGWSWKHAARATGRDRAEEKSGSVRWAS